MRIALISDIHGNYEFLKNVLLSINKIGVDHIYCLGDLVGYYDCPNKVIELIKEKNIRCLKGNHDKYLLGELSYDIERETIYRIKQHREIISSENLTFLEDLPDSIELTHNQKKIFMTHSLPTNAQKYLRSVDELDINFLKYYDYYFYGHTHIPTCYYTYGVCIVNPGSVGQPRDYSQKPSFAVIDFEEETVQLKKISVDVQQYCEHLLEQQFNHKLINILLRAKCDE